MRRNERKDKIIKNILLSAFIGFLLGALIFAFKSVAEILYQSSDYILSAVKNCLEYLPLIILGVCLISYVVYLLLKGEPNARGGGIPVAEARVRGKLNFNPLKVGAKVVFSSYCSYFSGLPLGSEGPSVLLGACVGDAVSRLDKDKSDNALIKAGTACAFSAITGAPVAGIFFIEEEMHDGISLKKILCIVTAIIFACLSNYLLCYIFNQDFAMFGYNLVEKIPLKYYYLAIICGVIAGVFSFAFVNVFTLCNKVGINKLSKSPLYIKILLCFLTCCLIAIFVEETRGSGHHLIISIENGQVDTSILVLVLILKLVALFIISTSGVSGGIFIPMLAIGAILGGILGNSVVALGVPETVYMGLIGAVSVSFLSGAQQSPLTAIFFSIEAMGGFINAPFTLISILVSFVIVKLLKGKPIYDKLLENRNI